MHKIIVVIFFFLTNVIVSFGQEKIAILIANQDYKNITNLKTPINEIDSISRICESYDFKTFVYKNIVKSDFNKIIDLITDTLGEQGTIYFHYSGHGVQIEGQTLIVPSDINKDLADRYELKRKCIEINDLLEALYSMKKKSIKSIICLDACRNNPFEELEYEMERGLGNVNTIHIPERSALIFSCQPGSISKDGDKFFSNFGSSWIKYLRECNINLSEIQEYVQSDMYNERQMAQFNNLGLSNFYFCDDGSKKSEKKNKDILFDYYSGVKKEIHQDFDRSEYYDVITKSDWIKTFLGSDLNKEIIELKYIIATSYLRLDSLEKAESVYNEYWQSVIKTSEFMEIVNDTYIFLGNILTIKEDWISLAKLRSEYVLFCKKFQGQFDLAITYDKIAGDYERQRFYDSAVVYYNKAIKLVVNRPRKTKIDKGILSGFYNNLGNFYTMESTFDFKKAHLNLYKSYSLNKEIEKFDFWLLFDLCRINWEFEEFKNIKEAREKLEELKTYSKLYDNLDASQMIQLKYLEYDVLVQEDEITNSLRYLKDIFNSYGKDNIPKVIYSGITSKTYGNDCSTKLWEICIETPKQVKPIIYIDRNSDSKLDVLDYILSPHIETKQKYSEIIVNKDRVTFQKNTSFKPNGYANLMSNKCKRYDELIEDKLLPNSFMSYSSDVNKTQWVLNIYLSDLEIKKELPIFVGLKGPKYNGQVLYGLQNSIVVFPVEEGVDYIQESLRYDYN